MPRYKKEENIKTRVKKTHFYDDTDRGDSRFMIHNAQNTRNEYICHVTNYKLWSPFMVEVYIHSIVSHMFSLFNEPHFLFFSKALTGVLQLRKKRALGHSHRIKAQIRFTKMSILPGRQSVAVPTEIGIHLTVTRYLVISIYYFVSILFDLFHHSFTWEGAPSLPARNPLPLPEPYAVTPRFGPLLASTTLPAPSSVGQPSPFPQAYAQIPIIKSQYAV